MPPRRVPSTVLRATEDVPLPLAEAADETTELDRRPETRNVTESGDDGWSWDDTRRTLGWTVGR